MQYFYDLSLLDVQNALSHCLRTLYQECECSGCAENGIKDVYCIEIDLTEYAAFHDGVHDYALMFFEKSWNDRVWKMKLFEKRRDLRAITTRVLLSTKATNNPPHDHHLFTSSNRYIDFANYKQQAFSKDVPSSFIHLFNQRFVGYLMRSERSFEDVHRMFNVCRLEDVLPHDEQHKECEHYAAYCMSA
ncbi:hypothetical protein ACFPK9_02255 [Rubritalea spongiae]|uniref:Uncharacterized protein n=1 Tax=Rubritalea spongiae TaxID=430797 RepID=A0ABW5E1V4_9BACT